MCIVISSFPNIAKEFITLLVISVQKLLLLCLLVCGGLYFLTCNLRLFYDLQHTILLKNTIIDNRYRFYYL